MQRIHDHHKNKGLRVDGMVTREVRKGDERIGFKITDLSSGAEGWLARMGDSIGPRIGKYSVDSEDLEEIGVGALKRAAEGSADLVLVDEEDRPGADLLADTVILPHHGIENLRHRRCLQAAPPLFHTERYRAVSCYLYQSAPALAVDEMGKAFTAPAKLSHGG